jgi:hypothetical protein
VNVMFCFTHIVVRIARQHFDLRHFIPENVIRLNKCANRACHKK